MNQSEIVLFSLLRSGLYGSLHYIPNILLPSEWKQVYDLALRHGVIAIAGEGLSCLSSEQKPPRDILMQWIAQMMAQEKFYTQQRQRVMELREVWQKDGVDCIEIKGESVGRYYPKPQARYSCDFDCFLSDYEKGNKSVEKHRVEVNRFFYKNSSFSYKGLLVENHQFCTPVRGNREMKRLERKLRELLVGCREYPSVDFNALFLMEHAWAHFFEDALTLKQLCDWSVFRTACGEQVDWKMYEQEVKACGFWHFSESMNRLADLMEGKREEKDLELEDKRLLEDILGEHHIQMNDGWKTRLQLINNYFTKSWKYKHFHKHSMPYCLCRTISGFLFDRNPKL